MKSYEIERKYLIHTIFFRNRKRKFQIAIRFSFCYDEPEDML